MAGLKADDKGLALEALAFLKPGAFDGVLRAEPRSVSPAVYGAFIHVMTRNTFLDELGPYESDAWKAFTDLNNYGYSAPEDHLLYRPDSPFWDDIRTAQKETRASIVAKSLADAMRYCEEKMGPERKRWQWGLLHTYHFKHDFSEELPFFLFFLKDDLNRGPFPAGGDCHTLNVAGFTWGKSFDVVEIPAMRMIVDFSLPDPAFLTTVPGQSGNPFSPHYDDMIKPYFLTGKNHPLPFMEENIQAQYKDQLILKP
jgi:acyl-homoserine-lactone acylase